MPILNVFNAGGKLLPDAAIRVMLAMTIPMPNDQQSQRTFLAGVVEEAINCEDAVSYESSKALSSLIDLIAERAPAGSLAGEILLQYISLKYHKPEHASLNKARWTCRRNALEGWALADGKKVPTSDKRFKDFWTEYRGVAHLWAAWQIEGQSEPKVMLAVCQNEERLVRFLGIAARLFLLAVAQVEGKELLFNLGPDPYIIAPTGLPDVKVVPPPPTEWALKVLDEYRVGSD